MWTVESKCSSKSWTIGEKELDRRRGVIRKYETLTRTQGENVTAFLQRFQRIERNFDFKSWFDVRRRGVSWHSCFVFDRASGGHGRGRGGQGRS